MSRLKRKPPVRRISIKPRDAAEEIEMMSALVRSLNETVQCLWDTVHDLRADVSTVRPGGSGADDADERPLIWQMPARTADVVDQVATLQRQLDELNGDAESLWFEAQWLRAQLAVSLGDAGL